MNAAEWTNRWLARLAKLTAPAARTTLSPHAKELSNQIYKIITTPECLSPRDCGSAVAAAVSTYETLVRNTLAADCANEIALAAQCTKIREAGAQLSVSRLMERIAELEHELSNQKQIRKIADALHL